MPELKSRVSLRQQALKMIKLSRKRGITWADVADETGHHHGPVSGTLAALHREGEIARLAERRNGSKIYVLPAFIAGRATEKQGRAKKACPHCGKKS